MFIYCGSYFDFSWIGITGQGQQGSNQQNCNPLGLGLNLGALPVNPALVAAALNQAGWGLFGNLQNQQEPVSYYTLFLVYLRLDLETELTKLSKNLFNLIL